MATEGWGDLRRTAIEAEKERRNIPPSDAGPPKSGLSSGWWRVLLFAEVGGCILSVLTGLFILDFAEVFTATWVPALGAALIVLGPLNLALTPLVRGVDRDAGWVRSALIAAKVLISVVLLPLLILGLVLVGLVVLFAYALTHPY